MHILDHRHGHHPRLHHPLSPPPGMVGIQEMVDENCTISPTTTGTSTPVVVQAPVPPQFADEPLAEDANEDFSSVPLLNQHTEENKNTDKQIHSKNSMNLESRDITSGEQIPDRNMVSFLPMSASIEDESVVNLTRF